MQIAIQAHAWNSRLKKKLGIIGSELPSLFGQKGYFIHHFEKVVYQSELAQFEHRKGDTSIDRRFEVLECLKRKSAQWSYEEEYRYILKRTRNFQFEEFETTHLKSVIVGSRMAAPSRNTVYRLIEKFNISHKTDAKIKYASLSEIDFNIIVTDKPPHNFNNDAIVRISFLKHDMS